jgi:hypothetical protein
MKNPWCDLPNVSPFVVEEDLEQIDRFNKKYGDSDKFLIQTQLLPEPFFGNVDAPVYALCLNPGFSPGDQRWHKNASFASAIRLSHTHELSNFPHYYLNPDFRESPGSGWWHRKCRWLIEDCGVEVVSRNLFCAEFFPYHSRKYKKFPRTISDNGLPDSSQYTAHLIREAIQKRKLIIQMRAAKQWASLIPELNRYERIVYLNNSQNVALSPGNLERYSDVRSAITSISNESD